MIHGPASYRRLSTCHSDLQRLVIASAEDAELMVVSGHRNEEEQADAVRRGASKVHYPHSRHNSSPSEAVDLAPWPLDWSDLGRFDKLARHVLDVAGKLQIEVTWGGHFTRFIDRPHFELRRRDA